MTKYVNLTMKNCEDLRNSLHSFSGIPPAFEFRDAGPFPGPNRALSTIPEPPNRSRIDKLLKCSGWPGSGQLIPAVSIRIRVPRWNSGCGGRLFSALHGPERGAWRKTALDERSAPTPPLSGALPSPCGFALARIANRLRNIGKCGRGETRNWKSGGRGGLPTELVRDWFPGGPAGQNGFPRIRTR